MSVASALPVSERLAGFAVWLREHGFSVGSSEQQAMLHAGEVLGHLKSRDLDAAWRAIACSNARQWQQWPELFEHYWFPHKIKGTVRLSGASRRSPRDLRQALAQRPDAPTDESAQRPGGSASAQSSADQAASTAETPAESSQRAMGGAARSDALHDRSQQMWMPDDLQALQALVRDIVRRLQPQTTRRWQRHPLGRELNLRGTLRRSLPYGGLPLRPEWQRHKTEPPSLFLLVDVSRSMESHAAFFLRVARAFAQCGQARVFVFHTRLAEVTALMQRDSAHVQEKINAVTAGFGAGTRIAYNLKTFARRHARAQLGRDSRIWILSDGYDTDAPEELQQALQGLRRHGARIFWFHPTRQRPAATSLTRAQQCVERFFPLASLADLAGARTGLR